MKIVLFGNRSGSDAFLLWREWERGLNHYGCYTDRFRLYANAFAIPAGQDVTLKVLILNNGAIVRNFIIVKLGASAGEAFNSDDEATLAIAISQNPDKAGF